MITISIALCFLARAILCQIIAEKDIFPGTIPALPSVTLEGCQKDALATTNVTLSLTYPLASKIQEWCGIYDEVLPCLDLTLPYTRLSNMPNWYLSLMFDQDIAFNISEKMCGSIAAHGDDMACLEQYSDNIRDCIRFQTNQLAIILSQLYHSNNTENPHADTNACLVSNYTAACMTRFLSNCSAPVVEMTSQYFNVLTGNCNQILFENMMEHRNRTLEAKIQKQKKLAQLKKIMKKRKKEQAKRDKLLRQAMQTILKTVDNIADPTATSNATSIDSVNATEAAAPEGGNQTVLAPKKKHKPKENKATKEIKSILQMVLKNL